MAQTTKEQQAINEQWQKVLDLLSTRIPESSYLPWVSNLTATMSIMEENPNGIIILKSSQSFGIQVIKQKYLAEIEHAIFEVSGHKYRVDIMFEATPVKKIKKADMPPPEIASMQVKIDNLQQMHSFCGLNLKYTFENFVVGENAKFAYSAACAVAQAPGQKYNPLFIYGSIGIGKTHLMQAIGHNILRNFPDLKVKYTKAEEFMNKFIDCIKAGGDANAHMRKFRDMYRNVDVLLFDDFQFIEGKKKTEEEIFNTFDTLFYAGKQIVFASDRPISTFVKTSDRLKSRYEWGLNVEISVPDFETRVAIVENYAKRSNFEISREVAQYLAEIYDKNVRELEGGYNKISAWASINGMELTLELAKEILGQEVIKKQISVKEVIEKTAQYFGITPDKITGNVRSKEIMHARQCAIYFAREMTDLSFPVIAKDFMKNHTTILYSWEKMKEEMHLNPRLKNEAQDLKNFILS